MKPLNNLSIKPKLALIQLLGVVGFCFYIIFTYLATNDVALLVNRTRNVDVAALRNVVEVKYKVLEIDAAYRRLLKYNDRNASAEMYRLEAEVAQKLDESLNQNKILSQSMVKSVNADRQIGQHAQEMEQIYLDLSAVFGLYMESIKKIELDVADGMNATDINRENLELNRQYKEVLIKLTNTEQKLQEQIQEGLKVIAAHNDRMWRDGIVIAIVWTFVSLSIGWMLTNYMLLKPIRRVSDIADRIAKGDLDTEVIVDRSDEIGVLFTAINKMRNRLRQRFDADKRSAYVKESIAGLTECTHGDLTVEQLALQILNYLVPVVEGQVGIFYFLEGNELVLKGSYAFTQRKSLSNRIKIGDGLVGQCALEKKTIILNQIPNDYMVVASGLGEITPKNIIVKPIIHEDNLCGVLEIAALTSFSEQAQEILDLSLLHIAIALASAMSRLRLSEMLDHSRQQALQMQKQQEEMSIINQELEYKAIALSESKSRLQIQQDELMLANEELEKQATQLRASEESLQAQQEELRVVNEELEAQTRLLADQKGELLKTNEALKSSQVFLEEKTRQLELSSRYKSEFLSTMSHELRTPLNSILILANSLAQNKQGNLNAKQTEHASIIHAAGADLLSLINDILDIAKIEEGKMQLVIETLNIQDIGDDLKRYFSHVAQEKNLQFVVSVAEDAPSYIATDRQRLEQVLKNFFSNAFKFTHHGRVSLHIGLADKEIRFKQLKTEQAVLAFAISDTGIGIAKDKQDLIFEAFQQADGTTSRKYGGTGLGLTISRELARLLGGEVQLFSAGENMGSTFTLYIPQGMVNQVDKEPEKPVNLATLSAMSFNENKRLVIIEDDPVFAKALADLASEYGFITVVAKDGEEGVRSVVEVQPDAVILDIGLPTIDGWTVMEMLRNNPHTHDIPIHCFSGKDDSDKALGLGAVSYYQKPASVEQIIAAFQTMDKQTQTLKRLLVVEDNTVQHSAIHELFDQAEIDITVCTTGSDALHTLKRERFDCMVLDLSLPDMDGYSVLEAMNADNAYYSLPVIIYTAQDLTREQEARLRKYADRIILKTDHSQQRLLSEASLFLHWLDHRQPAVLDNKVSQLHRDNIFSDCHVLLVDDDMRNIYALSSSLEEWGCRVSIANSGTESLAMLETTPDISIVLMDIMMPEMDGFEAMRRIRAQERFQGLPILALTAKAMRDDRAKCIEAGANDYIAKPIDTERLQALMRVWLQRHGSAV